ncbi:ATP-binding protein [Pseudactinotalea sp. HY160]|uniref:ATP-binding protein n=1 Tax=Pseudactinotalea sp. HY160 TaxID=2654490 RepID=UPI001883693F|nr:ATP-binding protein [Pseudactinotalea sp. HY160]
MTISFRRDPVRAEVSRLLRRMSAGERIDATYERLEVDLKEEAGRRDRGGRIIPGAPRDERVAQQLAAEAACMANTPGGGGLIVGVADDGTLVGADSDAEWLRHRVYEISRRLLTLDVTEARINGTRLLILIAPSALEPVRMNGKIHWRVEDHCVEVDASTWHARRIQALNYDWSADASSVPATHARPQALAIARDFLRAAGEPHAELLASSHDPELLRRLNMVTGDGLLTNAGVLAFVGRGVPSVDYMHRDYAGGDSTARVRRADRSALEELAEVFASIDARNGTRHLQLGLVVRQVRDIPMLAAREAVVNGLAHRDWGPDMPTVIEQVGRTLRVTSPGGFFGGVNESNIITHPSQSRNAALTQLLADLRVAEREGIGVDRMVREMVRVGYQPPDIREISGPFVRASLVGDALDEAWIAWLGEIEPAQESEDVYSLLLLRHLLRTGWIDAERAAPIIQLTTDEARGAIAKLSRARVDDSPLLETVRGTPHGTAPAWRLNPEALRVLLDHDAHVGRHRPLPDRPGVATSFARARGRISSTELGSIVDASPSNVGVVLKQLSSDGLLSPSNPAGRGRGFYYRWVGAES